MSGNSGRNPPNEGVEVIEVSSDPQIDNKPVPLFQTIVSKPRLAGARSEAGPSSTRTSGERPLRGFETSSRASASSRGRRNRPEAQERTRGRRTSRFSTDWVGSGTRWKRPKTTPGGSTAPAVPSALQSDIRLQQVKHKQPSSVDPPVDLSSTACSGRQPKEFTCSHGNTQRQNLQQALPAVVMFENLVSAQLCSQLGSAQTSGTSDEGAATSQAQADTLSVVTRTRNGFLVGLRQLATDTLVVPHAIFQCLSLAYDLAVWVSLSLDSDPVILKSQDFLNHSDTVDCPSCSRTKLVSSAAFERAASFVNILSDERAKGSKDCFANFRPTLKAQLTELLNCLSSLVGPESQYLRRDETHTANLLWVGSILGPKWDTALAKLDDVIAVGSLMVPSSNNFDNHREATVRAWAIEFELVVVFHKLRVIFDRKEKCSMADAFRRYLKLRRYFYVRSDVFELVEYIFPSDFLKFCGSWTIEQQVKSEKVAKMYENLMSALPANRDASLICVPAFSAPRSINGMAYHPQTCPIGREWIEKSTRFRKHYLRRTQAQLGKEELLKCLQTALKLHSYLFGMPSLPKPSDRLTFYTMNLNMNTMSDIARIWKAPPELFQIPEKRREQLPGLFIQQDLKSMILDLCILILSRFWKRNEHVVTPSTVEIILSVKPIEGMDFLNDFIRAMSHVCGVKACLRVYLVLATDELRKLPDLERFDDVANTDANSIKSSFWASNTNMIPPMEAVNQFLDAWLLRVLDLADFARKCARFCASSKPKEELSVLDQLFVAFCMYELYDVLKECLKLRRVTPLGEDFPCGRGKKTTMFQVFRFVPHHRVLRFCLRNVYSLERLVVPLLRQLSPLLTKLVRPSIFPSKSKLGTNVSAMLDNFPGMPESHDLLSRSTNDEIEHCRDTPAWKNVTSDFAAFVVQRTYYNKACTQDKATSSTVLGHWFKETSTLRSEISRIDSTITARNMLIEKEGNVDLSDGGKLLESALLAATALAILKSAECPPVLFHDLFRIARAIPPGRLTEICVCDATQVLELAASALRWLGSQPPTPDMLVKMNTLISTLRKSFTRNILQLRFTETLGVTYKSWVGSDHRLLPGAGGVIPRILSAGQTHPVLIPAVSSVPAQSQTVPWPALTSASAIPTSIPPPVNPNPPMELFTVPPPSLALMPSLPGTQTVPPPTIAVKIKEASVYHDGPPAKVSRSDDLIEHELYAEIHRLVAQKNELANRVEANRKASAEIVTAIDQRPSETLHDALERLSNNASRANRIHGYLADHSTRLEKLNEEALELCERDLGESHKLAIEKVNLRQKLQIYRDLSFQNIIAHHSVGDLSAVALELREHVDRLRAVASQATVNANPEHAVELHAILHSNVCRLAETDSDMQLSVPEIGLLFRDDLVPRFVLAQTLHRDVERRILDASAQLEARERRLAELDQ